MIARIFWLVAALTVFLPTPAHALVVGREGTVYPIQERDFLEVIEARVARVDQSALREKMTTELREAVPTFRLRDGVANLPVATKAELYRVDLSFTVTPALAERLVQENGKALYSEGQTVNPLRVMRDRGLQYPFVLAVVNAERKAELDWFKADGLNTKPRVKLLITDGYPYQLAEKLNRPVFQLTERMREQFQIRATPSLIFWPANTDYLAVRTIPMQEKDAANTSKSAPQSEKGGSNATEGN